MKNKQQTDIGSMTRVLFAAVTLFGATAAPAGLHDSWGRKAQIQFTGYNRFESLTNFPALVVLGTNISGFAYSQLLSGTSDLAFTADAAGLTNLNYEIDTWNTNGPSYVWVQVPALTGNTTITAWWGASGQTAPACTTNGATWNSGYIGVMHLNEPGAPYRDSTAFTNNSASGTYPTPVSGVYGNAQSFNGTSSQITLGRNLIGSATTFTVEHWVKLAVDQKSRNFFSNYHSWVTGIDDSNNNRIKFYFGDGGAGTAYSDVNLVAGTWAHVAVTYGSSFAQIYVNGLPHGSLSGSIAGTPPAANALGFLVGAASQYFNGALDEVRISNVARSSNWVWACYMNQASNTPAFQTYGAATLQNTAPILVNLAPSNVVSGSAVFNGQITSTGSAPVTAVSVYWGPTDGGTNAALWANTNVFTGSLWNQDDILTTNITLTTGQDYFYTYSASNANGLAMATPSAYFTEGALTLAATDAACGASLADTATVVVSRPANCTNYTWTVYYTTAGSAVNGVHYTASPASGSLTIPAGQTSATIILTPLLPNLGAQKNFTVSLAAGPYLIGSPGSAACTYGIAGGWAHKAQIAFSGYNRTETLTNFPALVMLGTNIPNFAYSQFQSGSNDLAFTADAKGVTNLNYELDSWNTNGLSYAWVQVPALTSNATVVVWWGAPGQTQPVCATNGSTWGNGFAGVWHLSESSGLHADSTTGKNAGTCSGTITRGATGKIGGADQFGGGYVEIANQSSFNYDRTSAITFEAWVKVTSPNNNNFVLCKELNNGPFTGPYLGVGNDNHAFLNLQSDATHATSVRGSLNVADSAWHHLVGINCATNSGSAADIRVYVDGALETMVTSMDNLNGSIQNTTPVTIGSRASGGVSFSGLIDEPRISTIARSSNWVWACYMNQASNGVFQVYGKVPSAGGAIFF